MTEIVESYRLHSPPVDYKAGIREVLAEQPASRFKGIEAIVLRDQASLTDDERRKGFLGLGGAYVRTPRGTFKIYLFVDEILKPWPPLLRRFPMLKYEIVHRFLFHELAHHLCELEGRSRPHDEDEIWRRGIAMHRASVKRRHPVATFLHRLFYTVADPLVQLIRRIRGSNSGDKTG